MRARRANNLCGADWLRNSFSIWRGLARDSNTDHPAPFPVALVSKLIDCYAADRHGTVLDPFAGSGSALIAALQAGMTAVGFDINPNYRDIFAGRLALSGTSGDWAYHIHDARRLIDVVVPASVEICVTSPPYWDILNRRRSADGKQSRAYSTNGDDLGNFADYTHFVDALAEVAAQVGVAMRSKGYFVLNVMDIRRGAAFYPLHQDAAVAVSRCNLFALEDIIVWDRQSEYNSMRPLGYPYKFIVNKVHEYLLVFRRGETNAKKTPRG